MHQAQGAIDTARAAGAADYATEEFAAAEAALKRSNDLVAERDYRQALNYALDARERAQGAAKSAAESRARVRSEAERLLASSESALTGAKTALAAATDAKTGQADLAGASRVVAEVEARLAGARALLSSGEYNKARAALLPLPERLQQANSEIDAVVDARQAKRPARRSGR